MLLSCFVGASSKAIVNNRFFYSISGPTSSFIAAPSADAAPTVAKALHKILALPAAYPVASIKVDLVKEATVLASHRHLLEAAAPSPGPSSDTCMPGKPQPSGEQHKLGAPARMLQAQQENTTLVWAVELLGINNALPDVAELERRIHQESLALDLLFQLLLSGVIDPGGAAKVHAGFATNLTQAVATATAHTTNDGAGKLSTAQYMAKRLPSCPPNTAVALLHEVHGHQACLWPGPGQAGSMHACTLCFCVPCPAERDNEAPCDVYRHSACV